MSVLAAKRKESKYDAIVNADKLYIMLIDLAQRNFGIKDLSVFVRKRQDRCLTPEKNIAKFNFFVQSSTIRLERFAAELSNNLRAAYTIFPISMAEYEQRREYQDNAIINCEQIINELQRIVDKLDVDINIYEPYIKAIYQEIDKIKRWRQRDNQIKTRLEKGNI